MTDRQIKAGILAVLVLWLALIVGSCLLIQRLEAQEAIPVEIQVTQPQSSGGMGSEGWIAVIASVTTMLVTIITLVFTQIRAMRKEAARDAIAAERARMAHEQRAATNESLVALTQEVKKTATGAYSLDAIKAIKAAQSPEGDPE